MRGLLRKIGGLGSVPRGGVRAEHLNIVLRGGRMTKVAGRAASFAPTLGTLSCGVASIAMGSAVTVTGALGGNCTGAAGVYSCAGPAAAGDTTQTITNAAGVTVTTGPGFGIDTTGTGGNAFTLTAGPGGGVSFDDQNASAMTGADIGIQTTVIAGGAATSITTTGAVTGGTAGINADHLGSGDLTIASSGTVTSTGGQGIYALSQSAGAVTVNTSNGSGTGLVTAATDGIEVISVGGSGVTVIADSVLSVGGDGILARSVAGTAGVDVTVTGSVIGGDEGIQAVNQGLGDVTVTASNAAGTVGVTGANFGIYAANYAAGALTITANDVTGTSADAIRARNNLGGSTLSVTTSGTVFSATDDGIDATNRGTGDLTIASTGSATGAQMGIRANNYYGGAATVSAEDATGTIQFGINATNGPSGTSLSVTSTGTVTGGMVGIFAGNAGTGDLTIASTNASGTGQVTGMGGVVAINTGGGAVVIETDNTTGQFDGIYAINDAAGSSISITARGTTTSDTYGITAQNDGTGGVTVTAQSPVTAGVDGINALNYNGGAVTVSAGAVTGTANDGVFVYNGAGGTTLSVTTSGNVTAGDEGIEAVNFGTGGLTISAQDGMQTAQVTGGENGIDVYNFNGGGIILQADNVTGTVNDGIRGINDNYGTSFEITVTGTVVGGDDGIDVFNYGSGDLTVTASNAMGTASVTGDDKGIDASNFYGGALTVRADNVTGSTQEDAIYTFSDAMTTTSSITTYGTITGAENGIYARHYGMAPLSITVSGTTTGGTASGIDAYTGAGGLSFITLGAGADVSGGTQAILNGAGQSNTYLNTGATLSGATRLGDGSDRMTIANATITGVTSLDGGDDISAVDGFVDVLRFAGFNGSFSADLLNWEEVVFDGSSAQFDGAAITTSALALQNGSVFSPSQTGFNLNAPLTVDASSSFNAGLGGAGTVAINGDVMNAGLITVSDGTVGDRLTVNGTVSGAGSFGVDVDVAAGTGDLVTVIDGTGQVNVSSTTTSDTPMEVRVLQVALTSSADAFTLGSANFVLPGGQAVQVVGNQTFTLEFDGGTNAFVFTPFDAGAPVTNNPFAPLLEGWTLSVLQPMLNFAGPIVSGNGSGNVVSRDAGAGSVMRNFFELDPSPENAIWMSLSAGKSRLSGRSTTNARFETDLSAFEIGLDLPVFKGQSGRLMAGASFSLSEAHVDVGATLGSGVVNTRANAATLSATWISDARFYAHGQLRYSVFSSDFFLGSVGPAAQGVQTKGWATSLEVGQAFDVSERLTLMPQLQVIHADVSGDSAADPFGSGLVGTITDGSVTTARLGMMAERKVGRGSFYSTLSYIHAFDEKTRATFAGNTFTTRFDANRLELRAGGQMTVGENSVLHGGLTLQGGLSDFGDDNAIGLTAGLRVSF